MICMKMHAYLPGESALSPRSFVSAASPSTPGSWRRRPRQPRRCCEKVAAVAGVGGPRLRRRRRLRIPDGERSEDLGRAAEVDPGA